MAAIDSVSLLRARWTPELNAAAVRFLRTEAPRSAPTTAKKIVCR